MEQLPKNEANLATKQEDKATKQSKEAKEEMTDSKIIPALFIMLLTWSYAVKNQSVSFEFKLLFSGLTFSIYWLLAFACELLYELKNPDYKRIWEKTKK